MELIDKLKQELIEQLNLEDLTIEEIDTDASLFGDDGICLDSIDALEITVLLEKEYGLVIADQSRGKEVMFSVRSLATFIESNSK